MNVACVQFDVAWENKPANYAKVQSLLLGANLRRDSLVLLPEMFGTGFSMNVDAIAEDAGGASEQFLSATARDLGIFLLAGVVTRGKSGRGRNETVVFNSSGTLIARYCKQQPFTPGGESEAYEAGDSAITFDWNGARVAPFICYDLRFPEASRRVALQRPQLMTFIASWPVARIHHWRRLLQARAIENQCYVAGVNRIGNDPRYRHSGQSIIVDWHGEILADAGSAETVITATLDLAALSEYRGVLPALADIRPGLIAS